MFKSIPNFGWYNRFGGGSEISHLNLEDSLVGVIVETMGVCERLRQRICPSALGVGGGRWRPSTSAGNNREQEKAGR